MKLLIVGCGYVGLEVVKQLPSDWQVYALSRSAERAPEFEALHVTPLVGNWLDESMAALPRVDLVLVSVPHRAATAAGDSAAPESGSDAAEVTHQKGLQNLLNKLPAGWQRLVYLSTTGVYGQNGEDWVDEDTCVSPTRIGPRIAVEAESFLQKELSPEQCTILRLAGIYGPGRVPLAAKLKAGEPLPVDPTGYLNLVHVADIARVILQVFRSRLTRQTYVFSDGNPIHRLEYYQKLAELCGTEPPTFVKPPADDPRAKRASSKRVRPARLVEDLAYQFLYPNYAAGLMNALGLKPPIDNTVRE